MTDKTISIIAGGYLGSRLATKLNKQKNRVKVSFRANAPKEPISEVEYLPLNIENGELTGDLTLFDAEVVVICIPPGFKSGLAESYPANVAAIVNEAQNRDVKHIIFTSSIGIYTKSQKNDEFSPFDQSQFKTNVLYNAECSVLKSSVKYKHVLRLAGLMGKERAPGRFKVEINQSNASHLVNMVMIDDVVSAITCLVNQPVSEDKIYNIVAPNHPTKQDFYRFAQMQAGDNDKPASTNLPTRQSSKWVSGDLIELHSAFRYRYRDLFAGVRACHE